MPASPDKPLTAASPTNVRFLVIGLCTAMSLLLYLDRFAISPATDTMLGELKLTKGQFGEAVSAFFLAYALMQIPSGWLTDTLGGRWTLAAYVACWSLATIGLGLADGLAAIWIMRLVLGIAQAGAYPAAAALLKRWVPLGGRGLANSSVSMGGRSGLLVALVITVPLMLLVGRLLGWSQGAWRVVFGLYGGLGLVWAAVFVWLYRDRPREHRWCNAAEAALIEGDSPASGEGSGSRSKPQQGASLGVRTICGLLFAVNIGWIVLVSNLPAQPLAALSGLLSQWTGSAFFASALVRSVPDLTGLAGTLALCAAASGLMYLLFPVASQRVRLPIGPMLASKQVWLMCAINFCVNIGWILLATWLPQYLIEKHRDYLSANFRNEAAIAALLTAVVQLAAMAGGLSGGRATDVLVRKYGRAWGRRLPGLCAGAIVCGLYLTVPHLAGLWWFVGMMIVIAFTIDFGLGATWASYQDIGGRHVASVLGVGNMCGNLGAAIYARLIGYLADQDQWDYVFWISAGAMATASCCWLLFDASRPIVREEPHQSEA
jgi:ACS family glucarate transporter-like MFS transporter